MTAMTEPTLTVREVAEATGLTAHTLRYYERAGLMLDPIARNRAGRAYTERHVTWLRFVQRLRDTGMPIRDILAYTELLRGGPENAPACLALLRAHEARVERHLAEVEAHLAIIRRKVAHYADAAATFCRAE